MVHMQPKKLKIVFSERNSGTVTLNAFLNLRRIFCGMSIGLTEEYVYYF